MHLIIGVILLAVVAVLIFIALPKHNGDGPRFLQFEAAIVLYPGFVMGVAEVITGLTGIW